MSDDFQVPGDITFDALEAREFDVDSSDMLVKQEDDLYFLVTANCDDLVFARTS